MPAVAAMKSAPESQLEDRGLWKPTVLQRPSLGQQRLDLLAAIRGQHVHIPDFAAVFQNWPTGLNPGLPQLQVEVEQRLLSLVQQSPRLLASPTKLQKLRAADFALFGASWWPWVDYSTLRTLTFLAIWLFLWDDEVDAEDGSLARDLQKSLKYRNETLLFVRSSLGLAHVNDPPAVSSNVLIYSFDTIGSVLRVNCSTVLKEIEFYIQATETEQRRRLNTELPTVEEYWACRMGTSAVGACIVAMQILQFPGMSGAHAFQGLVDQLNDKVNIIISALIPLLYHYDRSSIQSAVDNAFCTITQARMDFDALADDFLKLMTGANAVNKDVVDFLHACRGNCTGNISWRQVDA
ncbi:MAG: hypothetical protein Q9162_002419 [Coniocarpon cinnabarinum]